MSALVTVAGASKWYGPVIGINEVDLEFEEGITGLLGPNGAGKSTLMKLIGGLLRPSIGEVRVLGRPAWGHAGARRDIGYAPDIDGFHEEMTGREFVRAMARLSGLTAAEARSRTEEALSQVGMADLGGKRLLGCSKGMRQRIKVAQALVHDPRVLIFDEPLTGIDPMGRGDLMDLFGALGAQGKAVLISTHIIQEIEEITDRIVLLARGRVLAAGTVARIRDLLDDHPLTVRISSAGARELAVDLLARAEVAGVEIDGGGSDLVVRIRRPEAFFRALPSIILARGAEVDRVEPLDASAEAIFDYLVGGGGSSAL